MKSSACARDAASSISACVASGRPYATFSAIVRSNRNTSCGTMPIWRRSSCTSSSDDRHSVDQHPARPRLEEPRDERQERRLARAAPADDRDRLPRRDVERDPVQHLGRRRASPGVPYPKRTSSYVDFATNRREHAPPGGLPLGASGLEKVRDAVERRERRLEARVHPPERHRRVEELPEVDEEREQASRRHRSGRDERRPDEQDDAEEQAAEHDRGVPAPESVEVAPDDRADRVAESLRVAVELGALGRRGPDELVTGEALVLVDRELLDALAARRGCASEGPR